MKTSKITIAIAITMAFGITSCSKSAKQKGVDLGNDYCEIVDKYKNIKMGNPNPEKMAEFQKESMALLEKQKKIQAELPMGELQDFLTSYAATVEKCK